MDKTLENLYRELLMIKLSNEETVFDRIKPDDLCVSEHHTGRLYNNGLLIYGQAMNGWQNDFEDIESLIDEISVSSDNYKELYTMADYDGWHGEVDGEKSSYYYKRSKFWKLNYQVITNAVDESFNNFYIKRVSADKKAELLDNAWSQNVVWSNLYKISYSKGGNPDDKLIDTINDVSVKIILKEIDLFKPSKILFNTGENLFERTGLNHVFNLKKTSDGGNVLFTGAYTYSTGETCKIVVCKRPDDPRYHYTNTDIVTEAKEILTAFNTL